jgi:hypothetical protein
MFNNAHNNCYTKSTKNKKQKKKKKKKKKKRKQETYSNLKKN